MIPACNPLVLIGMEGDEESRSKAHEALLLSRLKRSATSDPVRPFHIGPELKAAKNNMIRNQCAELQSIMPIIQDAFKHQDT